MRLENLWFLGGNEATLSGKHLMVANQLTVQIHATGLDLSKVVF